MKAILYYIHDPMCSWCWGFANTLNSLLKQLPVHIEVRRLLGGLASDSAVAMPEALQQSIKDNWSRIEDTICGVKFNFDFWNKTIPRRSTYPACRAVIAARLQGEDNDMKMTQAIQRAYYLEARNPSDKSTLIELAHELGLSVSDFEKDLVSNEVQGQLNKEMQLARELYAESFPSLVLKIENKTFAIRIDYNNAQTMLDEIDDVLSKNKSQ
jgi:putative protein-disulfide isomerase